MARTSRMNYLVATLVVAFVISGCQSPISRWSTAWKERSKPKPNFQGVDSQVKEEVTYWPNKPSKPNSKVIGQSSQGKETLVRNSSQSKRDGQLADLIREGDLLRKNNQYDDARIVYNKALGLAPNNPDVHHRLAIVADKQHQIELADEHYQAALRARPRDAKLLNDIGYSYYLRGNTQLAEITLKEALSIDKTQKIAMANLGMIYAKQNRYPEALEMFRQGMSEADAQQSVAQLFNQNQNQSYASNGQSTNQGHSNASPVAAPTKPDGTRDYSSMSFDQIQSEMAILRQEAVQRRKQADQQKTEQVRKLRDEEENYQQQQVAQNNSNPQQGNVQGSYIAPGPQVAMNHGPQGSQQDFGPIQGQQSPTPGPGGNSSYSMLYAGGPPQQANNQQYSNNQQPQGMNGMPNDRTANPGAADQTLAGSPHGSQPARIFRGPNNGVQTSRPGDQQVQQGWDQRAQNGASSNQQPTGGISNASQMAIQLGMSAGPGSMFPVMQTQDAGNAAMGNQTDKNLDANSIEQTSNFSPQSPAPSSPIENWSSPAAPGAVNWQQNSRSPSNWSNDSIQSNGQGSGINVQNNNQRLNGNDSQSGWNSNQTRSNQDASRPYNGTWPNTNSLPQGQNQSISIQGRSPETLEIMGINPNSDTSGPSSFSNSGTGSNSNQSGNSLPMYPYAPNR